MNLKRVVSFGWNWIWKNLGLEMCWGIWSLAPLKAFNPSDDELTRKLSSVSVLVDGQKLVLSFRPLCDFVYVLQDLLYVCLFFWSVVAVVFANSFMVTMQRIFGMFFFLSSARKLTEPETTVISACIPENAKVQAGTWNKCIITHHFEIQKLDVFAFRAVRFRRFWHGSTCGPSKPGYCTQAERCTSCFLLTLARFP